MTDLAEAIQDVCWKATAKGDPVFAYIVPAGAMHRLIGAAQGAGIPAAFRSLAAVAGHKSADSAPPSNPDGEPAAQTHSKPSTEAGS